MQPGAGEILTHFSDHGFDGFPDEDERDKHYKSVHARHAFPTEGNIFNCQGMPLPDHERSGRRFGRHLRQS